MKTIGLSWIGTRTTQFRETVAFFRDVLGLPVGVERPAFVRLDLPDGSAVEVFEPGGAEDHPFFDAGPVVGFQVDDFDSSRVELMRAGVPLLGEPGGEAGVYRWQHFRAPDGGVYELTENPSRNWAVSAIGPCRVTGFGWVGTRMGEFAAMRRLLVETVGLRLEEEEPGLTVLEFPNGDVFELFLAGGAFDHAHLTTGPMPGFIVENLDLAERVLRTRGVEILARRRHGDVGWSHFRGPDGYVYEIKRFGIDGPGRWSGV